MKNVFISALIATATLAGAASAMTTPSTLENDLRAYPVAVDVNALSTAQVAQLSNLIHSGNSSSEIVNGIQSIVK